MKAGRMTTEIVFKALSGLAGLAGYETAALLRSPSRALVGPAPSRDDGCLAGPASGWPPS